LEVLVLDDLDSVPRAYRTSKMESDKEFLGEIRNTSKLWVTAMPTAPCEGGSCEVPTVEGEGLENRGAVTFLMRMGVSKIIAHTLQLF